MIDLRSNQSASPFVLPLAFAVLGAGAAGASIALRDLKQVGCLGGASHLDHPALAFRRPLPKDLVNGALSGAAIGCVAGSAINCLQPLVKGENPSLGESCLSLGAAAVAAIFMRQYPFKSSPKLPCVVLSSEIPTEHCNWDYLIHGKRGFPSINRSNLEFLLPSETLSDNLPYFLYVVQSEENPGTSEVFGRFKKTLLENERSSPPVSFYYEKSSAHSFYHECMEDLEDFPFPEHMVDLKFSGLLFPKKMTFPKHVSGSLDFGGCQFPGGLDWPTTTFKKDVVFRYCLFDEGCPKPPFAAVYYNSIPPRSWNVDPTKIIFE